MSSLRAPEEFNVHLTNFSGPFDLLLQLISKHQLDVTEVALSQVTDEFVAYLKAMQAGQTPGWRDLEKTSSFIVVAATLLDLKAARLLPSGEVEDAEDLALLEARDLLFARLLQYRAFKQISGWLAETLENQGRRHPRPGGLEEPFATLLPEPDLSGFAEVIAIFAGRAMTVQEAPQLVLTHLHVPRVSVREQADLIVARLRRQKTMTFRALTADAPDRMVVVGRFLALLDLFREKAVAFEQLTPLGELTVRWLGVQVEAGRIGAEFDEETKVEESE